MTDGMIPFVPPDGKDQFRLHLVEGQRLGKSCCHQSIKVDVELRTLECSKCGSRVEPFDYILQLCSREMMLDYRVKRIADYENRERAKKTAKQEKCKHRRSQSGLGGRMWCPTCEKSWDQMPEVAG